MKIIKSVPYIQAEKSLTKYYAIKMLFSFHLIIKRNSKIPKGQTEIVESDKPYKNQCEFRCSGKADNVK